MSKYKIQKNVPPPERKKGSRFEKVVRAMGPEDSIILDNWNEVNSFRMYCYNMGFSPKQRLQPDGKYRVWRGGTRLENHDDRV